MDTNAEIYKQIATINAARKAAEPWNYPYVERYVWSDLFAYSFGDMLVTVTNQTDTQDLTLPYVPYAEGTEVCNVFWPDDDCQVVSKDGLQLHLQGGESKIWLPKTNRFFQSTNGQEFTQ